MGNFFEVVDYVVAPAIVKEKLVSIFATDESLEEAYFIEKIEVTGAPPTVNIDANTVPKTFRLSASDCQKIITTVDDSTAWELSPTSEFKLSVNAGTPYETRCP